MPFQFNIRTTGQYICLPNTQVHNPKDAITLEGVCTLLEDGQDPTMMARPASVNWEPPYIVYRLGFHSSERLPEFQLLFVNDVEPTTLRGERPLELGTPTHIAGTYDGAAIHLYVNGILVASIEKVGKLAVSDQPTVFGTHSSTTPGGFFKGTLQEFRIWRVARTAEEINLWKHRLLPVPVPPTCVGLWDLEPGPPSVAASHLQAQGFSDLEIFLAHSASWYTQQYNKRAGSVLVDRARRYYSESIHNVIFIKAQDGYVAFYEPQYPEYLPQDEIPKDNERIVVYDWSDMTLSKTIQEVTDNRIKISIPVMGSSPETGWILPGDSPDATNSTIASPLRGRERNLPCVVISPKVQIENGIITRVLPNRVRAISPLVELSDGSLIRQYTWLFADFWFRELTRETVYLPQTIRFLDADLQALQWLIDLALPPELAIDDGPNQAIQAFEQVCKEFEQLLDRSDVDEVRDIQPFLSASKHRIFLSPQCKQVWPQKRLGNKHKVDFVVQESDNTYTAIEIESPKFPLYTKTLDPHHKLSHAEQQVRDYCDYIDRNRDSVEREEELPGIFRPRGEVVIGRRRDLSVEAARKLSTRNHDNGRYVVKVYDDLIDRARIIIDSVKAAIFP